MFRLVCYLVVISTGAVDCIRLRNDLSINMLTLSNKTLNQWWCWAYCTTECCLCCLWLYNYCLYLSWLPLSVLLPHWTVVPTFFAFVVLLSIYYDLYLAIFVLFLFVLLTWYLRMILLFYFVLRCYAELTVIVISLTAVSLFRTVSYSVTWLTTILCFI